MNSELEIIFGRNAVLSFLERASNEPEAAEGDKAGEAVVDTLARLRLQMGEEALTSQDIAEISRLGRLSTVRVNKILVADGMRQDDRVDRIWHLARKLKVPVQNVQKQKLDQICPRDSRHQGVVAYISPQELWSMDTFLIRLKLDKVLRAHQDKNMDGYMVALLDGVEDPHNLGAIIRVAESAGVKAIFIPQRRGAQVTGTVAKVSAGALANIPIVRVVNVVRALETLKEHGFWVVGLSLDAESNYWDVDLKRPLVVVIGGESEGISRLVQEHCDMLAKIPMQGKSESLNASSAAGIFFYEIVRQCGPENI